MSAGMNKSSHYCSKHRPSRPTPRLRYYSYYLKYRVLDLILHINIMTDNYQIDKNSKLYQKFLNLKINKNNQSSLEKTSSQPYQEPTKRIAKTLNDRSHQQIQKSTANNQEEQFLMTKKMPLHVTIDDIEQAASQVLSESYYFKKQQQLDGKRNENKKRKEAELQIQQEFVRNNANNQEVQESKPEVFVPYVPKEKARERRNRQFGNVNKSREEKVTERSFRNNDSQSNNMANSSHYQMSFKKQSFGNEKERENHEPNLRYQTYQMSQSVQPQKNSQNDDHLPSIQENHTFTLGTKDHEYKKKYQNLYQKFQQLKETVQKQRKQRQIDHNTKESQIQLIKEKYFELRSSQDTLTSEVKRVKDRLQTENMQRMKFEEEAKELQFKVEELEDMLNGKENSLKKKGQEASFWKNQQDSSKNEIRKLAGQIQKLQDRCEFLQSENKMIKKEINIKEGLIDELRKNINILIDENNIAKDEIYKLTIRSYQHQQANQILKGDINRRIKEQPLQMSYIQESYNRSIDQMSPKRREEKLEKLDRFIERPERYQKQEKQPVQGGGRKRQFAKQRAITVKVQERKQDRKTMHQVRQKRPQVVERRTEMPVNQRKQNDTTARIEYLQGELEKRKQLKAMNGKLRRQKIQIQRQLQQLLSK